MSVTSPSGPSTTRTPRARLLHRVPRPRGHTVWYRGVAVSGSSRAPTPSLPLSSLSVLFDGLVSRGDKLTDNTVASLCPRQGAVSDETPPSPPPYPDVTPSIPGGDRWACPLCVDVQVRKRVPRPLRTRVLCLGVSTNYRGS